MSGAVVGWSLVVLACVALTVFLAALARAGWRDAHPRGDGELAVGGLVVSEGFRAGAKRLVPVIWLNGLWPLAAALGKLFEAVGGGVAGLAAPMALAAAALMALFLLLVYLVVHYNRPRFIVAPHYRHEPGLTAIRRREGTLGRARLWRLLNIAALVAGAVVMFLLFSR